VKDRVRHRGTSREDSSGGVRGGKAGAVMAGFQRVANLQEMSPDAIALVDDCGTPVATDECGAMIRRGRGNQRVVGSAAAHRSIRQRRQELPVGPGAQTQERLRKARLQELTDDFAGGSVRRRQASEHRISLERAVFDEAQAAVEGAPRGFVSLVPGREGSDD
jgi:hypothetical protein